MLTRLRIRNFKLFDDVELELGDRVVLIGPDNAGKTTALQALALWDIGLKRWIEKRGTGDVPGKRTGAAVNRRDLTAVPVPAANLLWRNRHVRGSQRKNIRIEIEVESIHWSCGLEFDYANEESFYCRPLRAAGNQPGAVPEAAAEVRAAYLPPMSGLAANETRLDGGAVNVRLGEGRTAEVLRNLCYRIIESENGEDKWERIAGCIESLFGSRLEKPRYVAERGEITMTYRTPGGVQLDLSASGRGRQQTLLLPALARRLNHPAASLLQSPYVHYVANQPSEAKKHFHGLREAKPDLVGIALYDRLEKTLTDHPDLTQLMWRRREIENYLCRRQVLLDFAAAEGRRYDGEHSGGDWSLTMDESITEMEHALETLGKPAPWGPDIKASDDFLDRLFKRFYEKRALPNLMTKTDYHRLAGFVAEKHIDPEIREKLDAPADAAGRARPRKGGPG